MFNNHLKINKDKTNITWGIFGPGLIIPEAFGLLILLGFILNIIQYGFETMYIAPLIIGLFVTIVAFQRDYWVFDNKREAIIHKVGMYPFVKEKEKIDYSDIETIDITHYVNDKSKACVRFSLILQNDEKIVVEDVQESVSKQKIEKAANSISIFTKLSYLSDREIIDTTKKKRTL